MAAWSASSLPVFSSTVTDLFLRFFQGFNGLVLAGLSLRALFLVQCLARLFHGTSRLVEGGLRLGLRRHGLLTQVVRALGQIFLLAGQRGQPLGMLGFRIG